MSTRSNHDHLLKLLLVGDTGVGKTCLLMSFTSEEYDPDTIIHVFLNTTHCI